MAYEIMPYSFSFIKNFTNTFIHDTIIKLLSQAGGSRY